MYWREKEYSKLYLPLVWTNFFSGIQLNHRNGSFVLLGVTFIIPCPACYHSTRDLKEVNHVACFAEFLSSFTTYGMKMVNSRSADLLEVTAVGLSRPQKPQPTNKPQPPAKEWKCEGVLSADSSCMSPVLRDEQEESQELLGIGRA